MQTSVYSLKKVSEAGFITFLRDIIKPTISILNFMTQKRRIKTYMYLNKNNLCSYAMSKFLPKGRFKWIDPKEFNSNKCQQQ